MSRNAKSIPSDHGEYSGGPELIDPIRRADRVIGQEATASGYQNAGEELWEIYASNPADPSVDLAATDLTANPWPTPVEWDDPSTAVGTA